MAESKQKNTFHFESALKELETSVTKMESGDLALEDALKQFEQGVALIRQCQEALTKAEQTVEILMKENGKNKTVPYECNSDDQ